MEFGASECRRMSVICIEFRGIPIPMTAPNMKENWCVHICKVNAAWVFCWHFYRIPNAFSHTHTLTRSHLGHSCHFFLWCSVDVLQRSQLYKWHPVCHMCIVHHNLENYNNVHLPKIASVTEMKWSVVRFGVYRSMAHVCMSKFMFNDICYRQTYTHTQPHICMCRDMVRVSVHLSASYIYTTLLDQAFTFAILHLNERRK